MFLRYSQTTNLLVPPSCTMDIYPPTIYLPSLLLAQQVFLALCTPLVPFFQFSHYPLFRYVVRRLDHAYQLITSNCLKEPFTISTES